MSRWAKRRVTTSCHAERSEAANLNGVSMRAILTLLLLAPATAPAQQRARDLGIAPGALAPGPRNAITDVGGVRVGHATLRLGDSVRTGVTAILPHGGNL